MLKIIDSVIEKKTIFIRMILILLLSVFAIFSKINYWIKLSDIIINICDFYTNSIYKDKNLKKYNDFKNKSGGIIVFTHCTLFDQHIICNELNDVMKIVVREDTCVFPYNIMSKRIGHIMVNKNSKASDKIKEYVNERKPGDRMLMISPSAGYSNNDNQNKLEEFKSGAFLPLTPVLPVVIKYSPYINWKNGQSFMNYLYELMRHEKKLYTCKVLDEVKPFENETPDEFKERVKLYMESEMEKINVEEDNKNIKKTFYNGCPLLFISSHLFLIAAFSGFYFKNYNVACSLVIVYLTSIYYHFSGSTKAYFIDISSNLILGTIFAFYYVFIRKQYIYAIFGFIIFIIYLLTKKYSDNPENLNELIKKDSQLYHSIMENEDFHNSLKHLLFIHATLFFGFMFCNYSYQFLEK